jgi:hypothetical protein
MGIRSPHVIVTLEEKEDIGYAVYEKPVLNS